MISLVQIVKIQWPWALWQLRAHEIIWGCSKDRGTFRQTVGATAAQTFKWPRKEKFYWANGGRLGLIEGIWYISINSERFSELIQHASVTFHVKCHNSFRDFLDFDMEMEKAPPVSQSISKERPWKWRQGRQGMSTLTVHQRLRIFKRSILRSKMIRYQSCDKLEIQNLELCRVTIALTLRLSSFRCLHHTSRSQPCLKGRQKDHRRIPCLKRYHNRVTVRLKESTLASVCRALEIWRKS